TEGRRTTNLISSTQQFFIIPASLSTWLTVKQYLLSGAEHLLTGWDHVLFVIGLFVLLFQRRRIMILAITAFTLGHSLTLLSASMGFIPFNPQVVEIFIAITLIVLAMEILNLNKPSHPWAIRHHPFILTFVFGLIHGFGFASVLSDALTQEGQLWVPLLSFNIGIEIGQLLILSICLTITSPYILLKKDLLKEVILNTWVKEGLNTHHTQTVIGYVLGIMSSYWLISRIVG
ncbi:HupE/UreJ family protein, partial [Candidatus Dependentiae bacterium]|nr:HupE/UreJ family protein [Candidatus Dependentiae bacterium]